MTEEKTPQGLYFALTPVEELECGDTFLMWDRLLTVARKHSHGITFNDGGYLPSDVHVHAGPKEITDPVLAKIIREGWPSDAVRDAAERGLQRVAVHGAGWDKGIDVYDWRTDDDLDAIADGDAEPIKRRGPLYRIPEGEEL